MGRFFARRRGPGTACVLGLVLCLCGSCVGVSADIVFNADGSGTIALEYRLSPLLESLGKQDGNERWPAAPLGQADFERALARLPGMKLESYKASSREAGVYGIDVKLSFTNPEVLARFLDAAGEKSSFIQEGETARLSLTLPVYSLQDANLAALAVEAAAGYTLRVACRFPAEGSAAAAPALPGAELRSPGREVSFSAPVSAFFSSPAAAAAPVTLEFRWPREAPSR